MEAVFGDFKRNRRFRRFSRIGILKAKTEFVLLSCAYNIAKAVKALENLFARARIHLPKRTLKRTNPPIPLNGKTLTL